MRKYQKETLEELRKINAALEKIYQEQHKEQNYNCKGTLNFAIDNTSNLVNKNNSIRKALGYSARR